ncbi:hypothetical protein K438DRAFT_1755335 [Mycena galopus ATCC 62051]|nr:hypothetical protein K438DRAFT_1755335 [Mycena galopus ATCC 62051]
MKEGVEQKWLKFQFPGITESDISGSERDREGSKTLSGDLCIQSKPVQAILLGFGASPISLWYKISLVAGNRWKSLLNSCNVFQPKLAFGREWNYTAWPLAGAEQWTIANSAHLRATRCRRAPDAKLPSVAYSKEVNTKYLQLQLGVKPTAMHPRNFPFVPPDLSSFRRSPAFVVLWPQNAPKAVFRRRKACEVNEFGPSDGDIQVLSPIRLKKRQNFLSGIRRMAIYGNVG